MNKIAVFTQGKVKFPYNDIPKSYITSVVRKSLKLLTLENVSISIIVSDNDFITKINSDYRKKNYATDVISFAYREQPFPEIKEENEVLGDIYAPSINIMKGVVFKGNTCITGAHKRDVEKFIEDNYSGVTTKENK